MLRHNVHPTRLTFENLISKKLFKYQGDEFRQPLQDLQVDSDRLMEPTEVSSDSEATPLERSSEDSIESVSSTEDHIYTARSHLTDSSQTSAADFAALASRLSNNLKRRDLKSLVFLTKDILPLFETETMTHGSELIAELIHHQRHHQHPFWEVVLLIVELLTVINRLDLVKLLVKDRKKWSDFYKGKVLLLIPYRKKLFVVAEDLTAGDIKKLGAFLISYNVPKTERSKTKDSLDFLTVLENHDIISQNNLHELDLILKGAGKSADLQSFCQENEPVRPMKETGRRTAHEPARLRRETERHSEANFAQVYPQQAVQGSEPSQENIATDAKKGKHSLLDYHNEPSSHFHQLKQTPAEYTRSTSEASQETQNQFVQPQCPHQNSPQQCPPELPKKANVENLFSSTECSQHPPQLPRSQPAGLPCYKMNANPRGYCVIINNTDFVQSTCDDEPLARREGSEIDCRKLDYIFQKLQFQVQVYDNLTSVQMMKVIVEYAASKDHTSMDVFVCCVLSHGRQDCVYGVDGSLLTISDLTNHFKGLRCPSLSGKPKLFFIQACQGRGKQPGIATWHNAQGTAAASRTQAANNDLETDAPQEHYQPLNVPNEADILVCFATVPGYVSYRSRTMGSWYIAALVENLQAYHNTYDLATILSNVNAEVATQTAPIDGASYKQIPMYHTTLRKRIFFKTN